MTTPSSSASAPRAARRCRPCCATGLKKEQVVVVDPSGKVIETANAEGFAGVVGDATRSDVLLRAEVQKARQIVIATQRDDTAVLVTLTARQLNRGAKIVAAVREEENAPLLRAVRRRRRHHQRQRGRPAARSVGAQPERGHGHGGPDPAGQRPRPHRTAGHKGRGGQERSGRPTTWWSACCAGTGCSGTTIRASEPAPADGPSDHHRPGHPAHPGRTGHEAAAAGLRSGQRRR